MGSPKSVPTGESSGRDRFTLVTANVGGLLGSSSSMMVMVVVDGLPTLTPSSSVLSVRTTSPSVASLSWSPEIVKLAEFCPRAMVRALPLVSPESVAPAPVMVIVTVTSRSVVGVTVTVEVAVSPSLRV